MGGGQRPKELSVTCAGASIWTDGAGSTAAAVALIRTA